MDLLFTFLPFPSVIIIRTTLPLVFIDGRLISAAFDETYVMEPLAALIFVFDLLVSNPDEGKTSDFLEVGS